MLYIYTLTRIEHREVQLVIPLSPSVRSTDSCTPEIVARQVGQLVHRIAAVRLVTAEDIVGEIVEFVACGERR